MRALFAHDCPQVVSYSRTGSVLTASIDGTLEGEAAKTSWVYHARLLKAAVLDSSLPP